MSQALAPIDGSKPLENEKHERFAQAITSIHFGNRVQSYAHAFGYDLDNPKKGDYELCAQQGSKLAKDPKVVARVMALWGAQVMTMEQVRSKLAYNAMQVDDIGGSNKALELHMKFIEGMEERHRLTIEADLRKWADEEAANEERQLGE